MEVKKILIGQFRPSLIDPTGIVVCPCGSFLEYREALLNHWQSGHFDTPVFKYVWEENGKIVESLTDPEGDE